MFPLWINNNLKPKKMSKRPSPKTHIIKSHVCKSTRAFCLNPKSVEYYKSIEGTPMLASISKKIDAGITVEASLVLPIFVFFFVALNYGFEIVRLHGNISLSLRNVGNDLSVYGHMLRDLSLLPSGDLEGKVSGIAMSYSYVNGSIVNFLGEEYLDKSPLKDGRESFDYLESDFEMENDCFLIKVNYKTDVLSKIFPDNIISVSNCYYGHFWNGYEIPQGDTEDDTVYITENGSVYHESLDCTYLKPSVSETSYEAAASSVNSRDEKYKNCRICGKGQPPVLVYVTEDGTAIHFDRNCSGIKRTIYSILRSQATEYGPCHKCAN